MRVSFGPASKIVLQLQEFLSKNSDLFLYHIHSIHYIIFFILLKAQSDTKKREDLNFFAFSPTMGKVSKSRCSSVGRATHS